MSKEFKPYIKGTMGAAPDPTTKYVIDDGRLEVRKAFGGASGINLPPTSHQINQSMVQKGLDIGDVIVRGNGPEVECPRVIGVKAFITALYNTDNNAVAEQTAPEAPWHTQQGIENCGDQVLIVPGLPESFCELAHDMGIKPEGGTNYGVVGKWANVGERIFKSGYDVIKAPVQGQFLGSPNSYFHEERHAFLARHGLKTSIEGSDAACFYLPARGNNTILRTSNFHDSDEITNNVKWVINNPKKLPDSLRGDAGVIEQLKADWAKFNSGAVKVVHISEMPRLDPDYQMPTGVNAVMPPGLS